MASWVRTIKRGVTEALVTRVLDESGLLLGTYFKSIQIFALCKSVCQSQKAFVCELAVCKIES